MEEKVQMEPWLIRLKEERIDLLERTLRLQKFMEDPETKLNKREWELLSRQLYGMRDYLQALTERCAMYNLIESANLGLVYPSNLCCGK